MLGMVPPTPVDAADDPARSPAELVAAAIRTHIVRGTYAAGDRLAEEDMASEHGVSRTSVREALRVLASQGFVNVQPYFGTFVGEMTPKEAGDLIEVQGALEPLAAGLAAVARTPEHVAALRDLVERGRAVATSGRGAEASALHAEFHAVLAAASGNDVLVELMVALHHKLDWAYASIVQRPAGESWDEHARIVDAIELGDADAAVDAAHAHIDHGAAAQLRSTA
jgi:DNA-binding GntR family transcriptional regulator